MNSYKKLLIKIKLTKIWYKLLKSNVAYAVYKNQHYKYFK